MKASVDAKAFMNKLSRMKNFTPLEKVVAQACGIVQKDIQESMRDTPTQSVGYHTYNKKVLHYPSLPNNPPAVDTGTLRRSITFDVGTDESKVTGRVGSTILDPPYGAYLEFGTSRMIQRPWLRPALERNREVIKENIKEGVREIVNG
jgi:HK97 gp10 family phage protein